MRCVQCKGPYNEATGNLYPHWGVVVCGTCYRPFVKWVSGMVKRRWSGAAFYEEAATSVKPDSVPSLRSQAALLMFAVLEARASRRAAARP